MLEYLKKEANQTLTENGAVTLSTTNSDCLDLFATIGALRHASDSDIELRFQRAFAENRDLAMKIAFYGRDIRGGLGERRVFRTIIKWLANNNYPSLIKNIQNIPEYGRFDDLLCLLGNSNCDKDVKDFIRESFYKDLELLNAGKPVSLLGKWLPSINASSPITRINGKDICRCLDLSQKRYRKYLTALRSAIRIIENNLREKDYSFDYSKQPSRAMLKYRKAFLRNDGERYKAFLESVNKGEAKLHTSALFPYDVIKPIIGETYYSCYCGNSRGRLSMEEREALNATWNALEDFTHGENAIAVVDGSGSMYGIGDPVPATVAESLGIYFAERNTGAFHNHFITFSNRPQLVEIKGKDIYEKVKYCMSFNEVASTNVEAVFDLILRTAVINRLTAKDLPSTIYIISDMEFNAGTRNSSLTTFETAKRKFENQGYELPTVVFWNVQSRHLQQPVSMNDQGVILVSGAAARTFEMMKCGILSPYAFMMHVLGSERYENIVA